MNEEDLEALRQTMAMIELDLRAIASALKILAERGEASMPPLKAKE